MFLKIDYLIKLVIISYLPSSVITRFYFLLLCLRFLHSNFIKDNLMEVILRARIYQAALTWFAYEPSWYNQGNRDQLIQDLSILKDFCQELVAEENERNAKKTDATPHYDRSFDAEKQAQGYFKTNRFFFYFSLNQLQL